jgi:glycerol-1-phosphate dehydrogenase [NAD(P)+]
MSIKKKNLPASHTMELPRQIVVGEKNIEHIGEFLKSLSKPKKISIISGKNVKKIIGKKIDDSLTKSRLRGVWHLATSNHVNALKDIEKKVRKDKCDLIIGLGGGRSVDVAKLCSFNLKIPFVSIPTSASHDGIASPFVSIRDEKPHSLVATAPLGVFVDVDIIKRAPRKLIASGCGDLMAKITAVKDWKLGRDKTGEYYGRYSADLASMSAKILVESASSFSKNGLDVRVIVEALISAGVASCIAGSSRPCSGAEHLFSHAVDHLEYGIGLHGEKCGIGSIMIAKLQGQDWKKIVRTLKNVGAPTTAKEIGLKPKVLTKALTIAQSLRPERYTILKEVEMTESKALKLAKSTKVL